MAAARTRGRVAGLLALVCMLLGGLTAPASHAVAASSLTHLHYGDRNADLYVPDQLTKHPQIWILLHGAHQAISEMEKYGFNKEADAHGFIVVYPEGWKDVWKAGTCCFSDEAGWPDETKFINRVLTDVEARYPQSDRRIHVVGFSNGGMMAYTYACAQPQVVAVGGVAGAWVDEVPCARTGMRVHEIHSIPDAIVPYYGGYSPYTQTSFESQKKLYTHFPHSAFSLHTVEQGGHDWPSWADGEMWAYLH